MESVHLPTNASVFQAEAVAIKRAALHLPEATNNNIKYVRFFSDSRAILLALQNLNIKSQTILSTNEALISLKSKVQALSSRWIKAHNGFLGNQLADKYAKQGAIDSASMHRTTVTKNDLKNSIEEKCN